MLIVRRIFQSVYLALGLAILLPYGGVQTATLHLVAIGFFALAALGLLLGKPDSSARGHAWICLALVVALVGWVWVQAVLPLEPTTGPSVWITAGDLIGEDLRHRISIQPADSIAAILQLALPFAAYLSALVIFKGEDDALLLLRAIVYSGLAIAVFSLIQFVFFPRYLLFAEKRSYLTSLTGVFVNRNTAATYFGLILVMGSAMLFRPMRELLRSGKLALLSNADSGFLLREWRTLVFAIALLIAFASLMLTQSRGGIGATLLAMAVLVGGMVYYTSRDPQLAGDERRRRRWQTVWRIFLMLTSVAVVLFAGLLYAGRAVLRAEVAEGEDGRFCVLPGMLDLLKDNWLVGTGLATFRQAFAAYRDPACGVNGVWDMAHNVYIEGWVSLGVPFVVAAAIVICVFVVTFLTGIKNRRRKRWATLLGLAVLILVLAHSAFDFSLLIPGFSVVFAASMAGATTISVINPRLAGRDAQRSR